MGATVPFGFPYPDPGDPTQVERDIQALAEAVDAQVTSMIALASTASRTPSAVVSGPAQPLPNNTATLINFNQVLFDNAGYANLAVDPTALVLEPGVPHVIFAWLFVDTGTTGSVTLAFINGDGFVNTQRVARMNLQPFEGTTVFGARVATPPANGKMRVQVTQTSGTSANTSTVTFGAFRLG